MHFVDRFDERGLASSGSKYAHGTIALQQMAAPRPRTSRDVKDTFFLKDSRISRRQIVRPKESKRKYASSLRHEPDSAMTTRLKKVTLFFRVKSRVFSMAYLAKAGDFHWTGGGCVPSFGNRFEKPVRWLERSRLSNLRKMHFDLWRSGRSVQWRLKVSSTMEGLCSVEA